ncbi:hypothetical protein AVV44_gp109 [Cronobacter phage S13]|uniref:hypothetical protein n=1 Tax=Cronobacter phage S13 TaxID=1327935 RepID=UPI00049A210F|nr:hypothetical protein AVV44_gp109 [Cronobacter phage S13]AIA64908.1 hypothetical protein S13_109 [Cronobacter phage S13]
MWQHPHLQVYHIQKWMLGDCPRSYEQTYDYRTIKEVFSIDEVNEWYRETKNSKINN